MASFVLIKAAMMAHILLVLLLSLAHAGVPKRNLDIVSLNPRSDKIDGITFPRHSETKYRGSTDVQYSRSNALVAMLGGEAPLESILFSGTKQLLMKQQPAFLSQITSNLLNRGIYNKVTEALSNNGDKAFSEAQAINLAFKFIEDDLINKHRNGNFVDHYVDYRSAYFELFPQDMIFSTVYLEVANIYSKLITVIEDNPAEMVDLNYWNKTRNGAWVFTVNKWVDKGEFISPILIESEKITGFMEYRTQVPDYRVYRALPNELDLAFMKTVSNGETHILVFDGTKYDDMAPAIVKQNDLYYQADSQFDPTAEIPKKLKPRKGTAFLMGIIKLCPKTDTCQLKTQTFSKYRRSKRELDARALTQLSEIEVNGKTPKIFYHEGSIAKDEVKSVPPKPVYPDSKALMKKILYDGKLEKFLSPGTITTQSATVIAWDLKGQKLNKDSVTYFEIPDSYRAKKLLKVTLRQRQDPADNSTPLEKKFDASPAYTSIQFYALTDETDDFWRYWGGTTRFNSPKGSLFADLKTADQVTDQWYEGWNLTKGYTTDAPMSKDISVGAMRLLNVGTDPVTLHSIQLEFE